MDGKKEKTKVSCCKEQETAMLGDYDIEKGFPKAKVVVEPGGKLRLVPTKELVEELRNRAGVDAVTVEPYKDERFSVDGPCVVLVVKD